jgi:hypothetical protein
MVGAQDLGLPRIGVHADRLGEDRRVEGAGEVGGEGAHLATPAMLRV